MTQHCVLPLQQTQHATSTLESLQNRGKMSQNWPVYSSLPAHQLTNIFGIFMTQNARFCLFSCAGYPAARHWRHASGDTLISSQQHAVGI